MVSEPGRAFYLATGGLEVARAHTAARAIGLARGGLEDALKYAQERVQFGRPIGEFQAIRFKLAQMATDIEAARQLMYSVCRKIDTGVRCDLEEIGKASCRERVWQYVWISGVAVSLKK